MNKNDIQQLNEKYSNEVVQEGFGDLAQKGFQAVKTAATNVGQQIATTGKAMFGDKNAQQTLKAGRALQKGSANLTKKANQIITSLQKWAGQSGLKDAGQFSMKEISRFVQSYLQINPAEVGAFIQDQKLKAAFDPKNANQPLSSFGDLNNIANQLAGAYMRAYAQRTPQGRQTNQQSTGNNISFADLASKAGYIAKNLASQGVKGATKAKITQAISDVLRTA